MLTVRSARVALLVSCLVWLIDVAPSSAQQYQVLTVLAARREAPGSIVIDRVLQRFLTEHLAGTLDYYSEYLDVARFDDPGYVMGLREFLRHKYAGHEFDVVVAPTNASVDFLRGYRDDLFPGVPIVYSGGPGLTPGPNSTGVTHTVDLASTIEMAVHLQPSLAQVYVVSGASTFDKYYEDLAREQLRSWEERLSITYWSGLPLNDVLERVARLPSDAILYSLTMVEDGRGQRFLPLDSLDQITAAANVPVYHFSNLAMDHGIVGGALNSTHVLAGHLAELTLRVLQGEKPDDIPVVPVDILVEEVDWRQLQRWGISEARVPDGTIMRFKEPGAWERYRYYVIATVAVVLMQMTLIAGLLVQRRRRQRTEGALRASYTQNQDLVGRLITAQEAERSRIARDLHDEVSQELAGLAISLSMLRGRLNGGNGDEDLGESLAQVQRRTVSLGEDIRTLSHELHPGVLQHAGLVPALRSYCAEFERHQSIRATFDANADVGDLEPDVALCLYRAAQEALTNTARHSSAGSVHVALRRTAAGIDLVVSDDGSGFDPEQHDQMGLGLRSIDERVRLARGIARVESQPGRGTRLLVTIPLSAAPRLTQVVET